jgi:hypothetical protein
MVSMSSFDLGDQPVPSLANEDVIDLYNRVKLGTIVVVLAPTEPYLSLGPHGTDGPNA